MLWEKDFRMLPKGKTSLVMPFKFCQYSELWRLCFFRRQLDDDTWSISLMTYSSPSQNAPFNQCAVSSFKVWQQSQLGALHLLTGPHLLSFSSHLKKHIYILVIKKELVFCFWFWWIHPDGLSLLMSISKLCPAHCWCRTTPTLRVRLSLSPACCSMLAQLN